MTFFIASVMAEDELGFMSRILVLRPVTSVVVDMVGMSWGLLIFRVTISEVDSPDCVKGRFSNPV